MEGSVWREMSGGTVRMECLEGDEWKNCVGGQMEGVFGGR